MQLNVLIPVILTAMRTSKFRYRCGCRKSNLSYRLAIRVKHTSSELWTKFEPGHEPVRLRPSKTELSRKSRVWASCCVVSVSTWIQVDRPSTFLSNRPTRHWICSYRRQDTLRERSDRPEPEVSRFCCGYGVEYCAIHRRWLRCDVPAISALHDVLLCR